MKFTCRRSPVYATHGMVASSQPLATITGLRILQQGGNAADAAVATAAALNVTEPTSTGIGGDCFCTYYDAHTRTVKGLNGSGRAPHALTLEYLRDHGVTQLTTNTPHSVTVPGAAAGWADALDRYGTMPLSQVLAPAIELAEQGFPVSPITARAWDRGIPQLRNGPHGNELLIDGRAPRAGELMRNPNLARTFRELAEHGKPGFYEGRVADEIVKVLADLGGTMTTDDLKNHRTTYPTPTTTNHKIFNIINSSWRSKCAAGCKCVNRIFTNMSDRSSCSIAS